MNTKTWSAQQTEIFKWFATPARKRAVVRARAGTGKTTTIIEGINHAPEQKILLCAFNKRIATELQQRLANPYAEAKTLHGVGFAYIRRNWERVNVDNGRGRRLAQQACGMGAPDAIVSVVQKLASLGKEMAPHAKVGDLADIAVAMDCLPDPEWEEDGWTIERIEALALRAMQLAMVRDGTIDFSDMLYLPLVHNWVRGSYDLIVVDECQDMNASQIELAMRSVSKSGRIIVVGDDRQAIYGFRGADSGSLDRLKKTLEAEELPLTITYRCAQSIVTEAQRLVPDYQAAPGAKAGTIRGLPVAKLSSEAQPGDFVISRKNAPLMGVCLSILRTGKRAKIEGKDVGKGLLALIRKLKAKSMPDFLAKIDAWAKREITRLAKLKPEIAERKGAEIEDQAETLRVLAEGLSGLRELEARIESLFEDDVASARASTVVCSTIHRVKGLEADRAFILRGTLATGKRAGLREEMNCEYVAITRAKNELIWVEG